MAISTLVSRNLLPYLTGLALCLSINLPVQAQQNDLGSANQPVLSTPQEDPVAANNTPAQRAMLQQELRTLLAENSRINQEKIHYLETQSQRVFWTQCLIGFLVLMMLVSLFSFWRLHVQHKFQHGIDALTTSLKHFQDSVFSLSFIDTTQLSPASNISSFQIDSPETEHPTTPSHSAFRKTLNPNTGTRGDEFSDIRGFFDAWLNVYKPGDPRYEEALAAANKPESPRLWLQMLDGFLQNKDQHGFEAISKEIKKFFNVKLHAWQAESKDEKKQLSDYPHVVNKILELWPTDEVVIYLERLLNNSRMNPREGFDLPIFEQLETLLELAQRPDRPRRLPHLKSLGIADFLFQPPTQIKVEFIPPQTVPAQPQQTDNTYAQTQEAESDRVAVQPIAKLLPADVENTQVDETPLSLSASDSAYYSTPIPLIDVSAAPQANITVAEVVDEDSLFAANEVRLQLALAYREIADTEGACLLLEDVMREASPAQQEQARQMLAEIEQKQARICGDSEEIYFADNSALTAAKKA